MHKHITYLLHYLPYLINLLKMYVVKSEFNLKNQKFSVKYLGYK